MVATLVGGPSQIQSLTQRTFTLSFTLSNWRLGLEFHSDESVKEDPICTEQVKCCCLTTDRVTRDLQLTPIPPHP